MNPAGVPERPVDVLVVGAGPAGALTALLAARRGLDTLVVERERFPRWKVCGACLNAAARSILDEAGVGEVADRGAPLEALELTGWRHVARIPLRGGVALRRSVLDTALLEAAMDAGARLLHGTVLDLGAVSGDVRTVPVRGSHGTGELRARVVVDAAGLRGTRATDGPGDGSWIVDSRARIGVGAVFPAGTPGYRPGRIHMVAGEAGYVGLVRTGDGGLNVAGALDPDAVRNAGGPGPAVAAHLAAAGADPLPDRPVEGWRGTPTLTRRAPARAGARYLRVGDAVGYVEPFTGEGMAWALAGARAAVPLVAAGVGAWSPALENAWGRLHHRWIGRRQRVCRGVAWLSRRPGLARVAVGVLSRAPWLATPLARETGRPFNAAPSRSAGPSGARPDLALNASTGESS